LVAIKVLEVHFNSQSHPGENVSLNDGSLNGGSRGYKNVTRSPKGVAASKFAPNNCRWGA
jgi:hypothetical protein